MNYKFPKSEKLRLKRHIERLFKSGKTTKNSPLSLKYLKFEESGTNLCGVSVPKRKFKKAVDRNRIKRQMREAYRLHKHLIVKDKTHFHMMFVYSTSEKLTYQEVEKALITLLKEMTR
ncbi:ribonuclease P protein component [Mesohalobacter halotolerans]|uniref:Ribonuclease P protein component n=1 Tax=Mesohalobacter halotolerans TaxID=1883405 RepID=A0A4U5TTK2_9FLAO|nr:ribonuclease P protein component [Mesohalobacter halotolerans]MBS3739346.1 ribonuclease P protein component [Psychroflexus sp.]TKS57463.1 ribonuclease P protein component [Mesohalobacter halotolerans]